MIKNKNLLKLKEKFERKGYDINDLVLKTILLPDREILNLKTVEKFDRLEISKSLIMNHIKYLN